MISKLTYIHKMWKLHMASIATVGWRKTDSDLIDSRYYKTLKRKGLTNKGDFDPTATRSASKTRVTSYVDD